MLPYCIAGIFFVEGEVIFVFFRSRVGSAKNLASENYAYVQIELHMHSNSSTTCWCCSILRRQLYQLWRAHCLLAAVCATNECVQTAHLEEGGKGEERTIKLLSEKQTETSLWLTNALIGFMLTCFCTICLVSTPSTGTDSNLWIENLLAVII